LTEFVDIIQSTLGKEEAKAVKSILDDVLNDKK